jgi:hypothetical protein
MRIESNAKLESQCPPSTPPPRVSAGVYKRADALVERSLYCQHLRKWRLWKM